MRRYRKGQIFRPPTAAESAANADALEGFRRRPPVPQVRLGRGDKILVKTHVDGIPARDGTTIYSAICTRLVETSAAEEKTLLETDEEIEVFNLETGAVVGGIYVQTGMTLHGTRCVEAGGTENVPIELKADLALFGSANAYLLDVDGVRTATEETVYDILGFYEGVGSAGSGVGDEGDKGWATRLADGKLKVVALSCDPPGDAP